MELDYELLLILSPLIILQLGLLITAFLDWSKQPKDMPNRMVWLVLILVVSTIGPVGYFLAAPRVSGEEKWLDMEVGE